MWRKLINGKRTSQISTLAGVNNNKSEATREIAEKYILSFESLDTEMQENLLKKGWTAEKFDSISQEERDQAIKCIAF